MKKIKLVISDLHLGKGRVLADGSNNTLEEFHYDAHLCEFINYYSSGEYAECEIELIINGDFLNFIQTDYKGHYLTVITESISVDKLHEIIRGHTRVFEQLRKFASNPKHTITYIVGNHDQCMLFAATREVLDEAVGTKIQYKNMVYIFDGVHVEHGHMYEAANRLDPKKFFIKKDLPEPILNLPFGSHFFVDFVMKIKQEHPHVDKIRPFTSFVRWGLLFETKFTLKTIFSLVWFFIRSVFHKDSKKRFPFKALLNIFFERSIFPDLTDAAKKILNDSRVHTVIFGHSHVYAYRKWGDEKEYFNTGTWTEITSLELASLGKITKLTYVVIEYPQEAEGRPYGRLKEWRGYHRIEEEVSSA